jgi:hypothetical protein
VTALETVPCAGCGDDVYPEWDAHDTDENDGRGIRYWCDDCCPKCREDPA